jgi:hypothetical protein
LWLSCPHCRVLFHIDDAQAGKQATCRACGNSLRIPGAAPKVSVWYYTRDRKPIGPVIFDKLKELVSTANLLPDDLVWQEGMPDWVVAGTVDGLFPKPPPVPEEELLEVLEGTASQPEPAYEIVDDEPLQRPTPEPEPAPPSTPPAEMAPEPAKPAAKSHEDDWGPLRIHEPEREEPIQVEPEFQIDFAGAEPPPRRVQPVQEAPPTVDLVLPSSEPAASLSLEPDIALAPDEPKLELGEPEPLEDEWSKGYDIAKTGNVPSKETHTVPDAVGPPPELPYPIQADGPPAAVAAHSENVAVLPMAVPVQPEAKAPPRDGQDERLARETRLLRETRRERQAWEKVRTGVNFVYPAQAAWTAICAGYFLLPSAINMFAGESATSGGGSLVVATLLMLAAILVDGFSIAGFCFCLRVPASDGSRTLAITTIVLTAGAIALALMAPCFPPIVLVALGAGFARWLVFLFFLQTIAQHFESHHLMKSIERLLVLFGGGTALGGLLWLGMTYLMARLGGLSGTADTAGVVTLICGTLCTIVPLLVLLGLTTTRYLRVLRDTVATIDEKLYRS